MKKTIIVMPVANEESTMGQILDEILELPYDRLYIYPVIDDYSKDRTEAQKGVSKMSTSYFIFTEVLANDQWHCINPQVMKLLPIEHLILVPTLRSDSRYQFEKAYRQLECDGHPFTVDEMSRNLQASVNDWLTPEDSVRIAVCYDDILKLLNTSGKEHSAFAL